MHLHYWLAKPTRGTPDPAGLHHMVRDRMLPLATSWDKQMICYHVCHEEAGSMDGHTHTHMHTNTHRHTCTCTQVHDTSMCMSACTHTLMHGYTCIHSHTHATCVHTRTHIHTCIHTHTCPVCSLPNMGHMTFQGHKTAALADYHTAIALLIYWQWLLHSHIEARWPIANSATACTSDILARPTRPVCAKWHFPVGLARPQRRLTNIIRWSPELNKQGSIPWVSPLAG